MKSQHSGCYLLTILENKLKINHTLAGEMEMYSYRYKYTVAAIWINTHGWSLEYIVL